jgi:SP family general alpha glucoside:H+ symporter-like MFS transporter
MTNMERDVEQSIDIDLVKDETIIISTKEAAEQEKKYGIIESFRRYPMATFWSLFLGMTIIMAGYDGQLVPSFYGVGAFVNKYGSEFEGQMEITAAWQSGLGMGNPIGQVVGTLAIPWPSEVFGRKKVLFACLILLSATNFIQFFAPNLPTLCAGEVLAGLIWGAFISLAPTYVSEISPLPLRGILEAYMNMAFVIGQFVAAGAIEGFSRRTDKWAYRAPFALQWLWCVLLLVGMFFIPESPWYLVRRGRHEDAKRSLERLGWSDVDTVVQSIDQTDRLEQEFLIKSSYVDCYRGTNLRRTEICSMLYVIPMLSGLMMIAYSLYFFELAGMSQNTAVKMTLGNNAIGLFAGFCSYVAVSLAGRRTIYLTSLFALMILMFVIGGLDCAPTYDENASFSWAQASLLDVYTFIYQMTTGPMTFVVLSEVSATKLRSRTIAVATASQALISIAVTIAVPYMFNPENGNMRGKIGFVFGGLAFLCLTWSYFRLPETKGRTFRELDIMFERKVATRQFRSYNIYDYHSSS